MLFSAATDLKLVLLKKSGRRRLDPTSAGGLVDKGVLCLFCKTEATRGAGAWS